MSECEITGYIDVQDIVNKRFCIQHSGTSNPVLRKIELIAQKYFQRGQTAVREGRKIRSFDEAFELIVRHLAEHGLRDVVLNQGLACVFAKYYRAGVESAQ